MPGTSSVPSRRRGRPSLDEVASISAQILEISRQMFESLSFDDVSIEAIAAAAGVKKNTIYKRFADKRALLRAVLTQQLGQWSDEQKFVAVDGNLADNLKAWAAQLLQHAVSPDVRKWSRLADAAWPSNDELEERREILGYGRAIDQIERAIAAAGGDEAVLPRFAATALMSILTDWTDTTGRRSDPDDIAIEVFSHAAVDLVVRGCGLQDAG